MCAERRTAAPNLRVSSEGHGSCLMLLDPKSRHLVLHKLPNTELTHLGETANVKDDKTYIPYINMVKGQMGTKK
jgi:hypothetical protein